MKKPTPIRTLSTIVLLALVLGTSMGARAQPVSPLELKQGDRVVFLGDVLMEREQVHGHIETALTIRFPDHKAVFRNLGWSGDTPTGVSRAGLSLLQAGKEPADEGFKQLTKQLELVRPTVVFLGYGMANSLESGAAGLPGFIEDLAGLMDAIQSLEESTDVRFVLLSPIHHEDLGQPWPDPDAHNAVLEQYTAEIRKLAHQRNAHFVDLFTATRAAGSGQPITDNGIHLNEEGYKLAARAIEEGLGYPGNSGLRSAKARQIEYLQREIVNKNELFFHRSRPQNMAYILGFRKHEQGQNAVEIPQFDPLIEKAEIRIALLRRLDANQGFLRRFDPAEQPAVKSEFSNTRQEDMEFDVADGFEVNLFAENPLLAKPIQINFDAHGNLWVASSAVYPQIKPGQEARDSILRIEDTDGDGVADKSTVFAEGLLIPTAVIPGDGGVYVGQSTELLFFKDRDGDGKADEKRIVLSGFGTEDTHHTLHTLRWGHDGRLYFNQSIYIRSHLETPHRMVRLISGGILRLRTDNLDLGIFARGWVNSWGHQFDDYGQSFVTDGAGFWGINYGIPGAMYVAYAGARRVLDSVSPGTYPKFASLEAIHSEHFPADWQGDLITCDFRAHRIVRFKIREDGAGYVTSEMPDLLRTANATFRPIDVKLGPDGALYVADWSNPIIQHGEVDFRDPRRDKEHGRIWRITAKKRPLVESKDIANRRNSELLELLHSPNEFERTQATRRLTERGKSILPHLRQWTAKKKSDKESMRALWIWQAINEVNRDLLNRVLNAKDGRIRAAGVRVLSHWSPEVENAGDLLAGLVNDSHPRVRLEAVRALAGIPDARSAELVLSALDHPVDRFLDYGIWLSINELSDHWISAIKTGKWKPEGREKQLEFGLKAIQPQQASEVLAQLMPSPLPRDGSGPWIDLLAQTGDQEALTKLWNHIPAKKFDDTGTAKALNALGEAARLRKLSIHPDRWPSAFSEPDHARKSSTRPDQWQSLKALFADDHQATAQAAIQLAGAWKAGLFADDLLQLAQNAEAPDEIRQAAVDSLRNIGGKKIVDGLKKIAAADPAGKVAGEAAAALAALDFGGSRNLILKVLGATEKESAALPLWRSLLAVKNAGRRLAKGIPQVGLPETVARAGLRVAREGGRNEPELVKILLPMSGTLRSMTGMSDRELKAFSEQTAKQGDAFRGEQVYRRQELGCVTCHAIGGAGGKVGPDLTSIGASAPIDYLAESMVFPDRKIKEGYHSVIVETKDDEEYSGIVAGENDRELVLRDAANNRISIAKNNLANRRNGKSLMPAGLLDVLPDQDRLDLVRFLSELGKPGPFDASQSRVARVWNIFTLHSTNQQEGADKAARGDLSIEGWTPVNSTVVGGLLREDLQKVMERFQRRGVISLFAATRFQAPKDGTITLEVEGPEGAEVFLDGESIGKGGTVKAKVEGGQHTVVLKLDPRTLPDQVRLKSGDVTFLVE